MTQADADFWLKVVNAIGVTVVVPCFLAWLKRGQDRAAEASTARASQVKKRLRTATIANAEHLDRQDAKLDTIHVLTNSNHGAVLRTVRDMARELANLKRTPEATRIAEQASLDYDDHQARQAVVDSQAPNPEG